MIPRREGPAEAFLQRGCGFQQAIAENRMTTSTIEEIDHDHANYLGQNPSWQVGRI
jgi:hypothetical protein